MTIRHSTPPQLSIYFLPESLMQGPKVSHKDNDELMPNAKTGLIDL